MEVVMAARKVYAISSGSYSDYRVLGVAEDEETAKTWAAAIRNAPDSMHHDADVEEMTFIPAGAVPKTRHRVSLMQEWWDDGTERRLGVIEAEEYEIASYHGEVPVRPKVRFVRAPMYGGLGGRIEIEGRTRAAVMKVYSEQKAVWKSSPKTYKAS